MTPAQEARSQHQKAMLKQGRSAHARELVLRRRIAELEAEIEKLRAIIRYIDEPTMVAYACAELGYDLDKIECSSERK